MRKATLAALATISFVLIFQNCSVGGDGGMTDLGSAGPVGAPTISSDKTSIVLATGATNISLTGRCETGAFKNYFFEFGFKPTGSSSESIHSPPTNCTSGRYAVTIALTALSMTSGQAGTVTARLVGVATAGNTPSATFSIALSWGGTSTTGTATTGTSTTGGTTGSTTGGTTGSTTGTTGGPCPTLTTGHACRCSVGWTWPAPVIRANATECRSYCNSNNAQCCEFHQPSGECYTEAGSSCHLDSGWPEWSSSVCN